MVELDQFIEDVAILISCKQPMMNRLRVKELALTVTEDSAACSRSDLEDLNPKNCCSTTANYYYYIFFLVGVVVQK